ncbi:chemotaxis protein CheW [Marivirga arenosa]|uniref:Chemotaxis protein CheW n=1 Tax=Marivirga arenosa TaxID=3059076 RepID=A0AA49JDE6_9BACT|nr:chemotaxis protein CheW [Marivirga sp. BKB1-2]WKK83073.2 chemotaxis protein CheW [Marivirga sp. BKB1-2]
MSNSEAIEKNEDKIQIVVFRLGDEEYGLHIDQIKEVVLTPNITKMPKTPDYVKGVANIRGNVIAIVDLSQKFGLEATATNMESSYTLVIESDEYKMGLLVKDVPNTLSINVSTIEDDVFTGESFSEKTNFSGIVKMEDRLIVLIDIINVITDQEASQLFNKQKEIA